MPGEKIEFENGKLVVEVNKSGNATTLKIQGNIDEDFNPDKLLQFKAEHFNIDFEKVSMINSCGIREWISFIEKAGENSKFTYFNCPQIIIQQMNIVDGFLSKNARVESFYAPYYNEDNDEEVFKLLSAKEIKDLKAPQFENLEFDAIEKQYFNFLNIQK